MWCDVMWCDVMWCVVMWCVMMWCDVMKPVVVQNSTGTCHEDSCMHAACGLCNLCCMRTMSLEPLQEASISSVTLCVCCAEPNCDYSVAHSAQQHLAARDNLCGWCVWLLQGGQHTRDSPAGSLWGTLCHLHHLGTRLVWCAESVPLLPDAVLCRVETVCACYWFYPGLHDSILWRKNSLGQVWLAISCELLLWYV